VIAAVAAVSVGLAVGRRRVGHLDLDATRATWATRPMRRGYEERPRGPARIVVRSL
jgi:hypothetical protein